jgi:hypothetical protein
MTQVTDIVKRQDPAIVASPQLSSQDVISQVKLIQEVMHAVMQKDQHYGVIPGCGNKPTLLKPGAEKLALTFRLAPAFDTQVIDMGNGHREYRVQCSLRHIISGDNVGQGVGSCSTMESKYRYRNGERKCPDCGAPAIKRSKFPPKGEPQAEPGWYCYAKAGGCGKNFSADDQSIIGQQAGRVDNPDIADVYNTVWKMAKKRAQVDATLTATAASDIFTQDIEDFAPTPEQTRGGEDTRVDELRERFVEQPQAQQQVVVDDRSGEAKPAGDQGDAFADVDKFLALLGEACDARGWVDKGVERKMAAAKIKKDFSVSKIQSLLPAQRREVVRAIAAGEWDGVCKIGKAA